MAKATATKPSTGKSSPNKPATTKSAATKPAAPKQSSKKSGYGANDPTFKWQMGGLLAGVVVAIFASTQQGKQVM